MNLSIPLLFSNNFLSVSEFTLNDLRTISFNVENDSDNELYNFLISKIRLLLPKIHKINKYIRPLN